MKCKPLREVCVDKSMSILNIKSCSSMSTWTWLMMTFVHRALCQNTHRNWFCHLEVQARPKRRQPSGWGKQTCLLKITIIVKKNKIKQKQTDLDFMELQTPRMTQGNATVKKQPPNGERRRYGLRKHKDKHNTRWKQSWAGLTTRHRWWNHGASRKKRRGNKNRK